MGIRIVSAALTLICIFLLPPFVVVPFFIALGLGHFALAFWYQKSAGRWGIPAIGILLLLFALIAFAVNATSTSLFFVITGIYTSLHMAWDEVHLLKGAHSLFTTLEMLPFVTLYGGLLIDANFDTHLFVAATIIAAAELIVYAVFSLIYRRALNGISLVNLGWGIFALSVYTSFLFSQGIAPAIWFLGLAVIHYFIWYGEYAYKVAGNPERRATYYRRVALVNIVLFIALVAWMNGFFPVGGIIFIPTFFYVWAFLHVTSSTRLADMRRLLSLS
jgi:hypothetical protein